MTIYELYDRDISSLSLDDQLNLAQLILRKAAPDTVSTPVEAMERYTKLIDEAYASGPATPFTDQDFEDIKQVVRERSAQRNGKADA